MKKVAVLILSITLLLTSCTINHEDSNIHSSMTTESKIQKETSDSSTSESSSGIQNLKWVSSYSGEGLATIGLDDTDWRIIDSKGNILSSNLYTALHNELPDCNCIPIPLVSNNYITVAPIDTYAFNITANEPSYDYDNYIVCTTDTSDYDNWGTNSSIIDFDGNIIVPAKQGTSYSLVSTHGYYVSKSLISDLSGDSIHYTIQDLSGNIIIDNDAEEIIYIGGDLFSISNYNEERHTYTTVLYDANSNAYYDNYQNGSAIYDSYQNSLYIQVGGHISGKIDNNFNYQDIFISLPDDAQPQEMEDSSTDEIFTSSFIRSLSSKDGMALYIDGVGTLDGNIIRTSYEGGFKNISYGNNQIAIISETGYYYLIDTNNNYVVNPIKLSDLTDVMLDPYDDTPLEYCDYSFEVHSNKLYMEIRRGGISSTYCSYYEVDPQTANLSLIYEGLDYIYLGNDIFSFYDGINQVYTLYNAETHTFMTFQGNSTPTINSSNNSTTETSSATSISMDTLDRFIGCWYVEEYGLATIDESGIISGCEYRLTLTKENNTYYANVTYITQQHLFSTTPVVLSASNDVTFSGTYSSSDTDSSGTIYLIIDTDDLYLAIEDNTPSSSIFSFTLDPKLIVPEP